MMDSCWWTVSSGPHIPVALSQKDELALWTSVQHPQSQLEEKQNGKWDFGDLGHGRQKKNGVREEPR